MAHLGYFRTEFVERRQWLDDNQYAQLVALAQLLPGPASSQVGFALGMYRAGWAGGLCAFVAFTLPSIILMVLAAAALVDGSSNITYWVIHGLKLAAVAVVCQALVGMFSQFCLSYRTCAIMLAGLIMMVLIHHPLAQLAVIAMGALAGGLLLRNSPMVLTPTPAFAHGSKTGWFLIALFGTLLICLPLVASAWPEPATQMFDHLYRTGALVFGGGHVVLPLLQDGVTQHGWISNNTFLAGYGAAQTLPGPLFSIAAYLGWLMPAGSGGVGGVVLAITAIFLPGFLLMGGVLPIWRQTLNNQAAAPLFASVVPGINAAVVGLLAAALINPLLSSSIGQWTDGVIAAIAFAFLYWLKLSPLLAVIWCVAVSLLLGLT